MCRYGSGQQASARSGSTLWYQCAPNRLHTWEPGVLRLGAALQNHALNHLRRAGGRRPAQTEVTKSLPCSEPAKRTIRAAQALQSLQIKTQSKQRRLLPPTCDSVTMSCTKEWELT